MDWGLLPSAALNGFDEAQQQELQSQATKQYLLGALLSGDPSMAYRSAVALPEQAILAQNRLMDMQEKARALQEESAWSAKYNPTKYQETSPEFSGPVNPDVYRQQTQIGQARAAGLPTADVDAALRDLTTMRSPRQAQMLSAFQASLPKTGEGGTLTGPGGRYLGTVPQFSPSQGIVYGANVSPAGQVTPYSQEIPGAIQTRGRIAATETQARELNTPRQVPGASGAPTFIYPNAPTGAGGATGATGVGDAVERPQTASDVAKNKAAEEDYVAFSKAAFENAQTAPTRRQSAEFLYSAADKMDPNAATPFFAQTAGYLRVIPGVGDKYDSFVGDYKLMNQTRSKNILTGFQSVKGNANPQEVKIVEDAANNPVQDPKWTTKWVSALEIATADKDLAKENWKSNYQGEARKATTAWQNSPENPRIYNHPKVEQFLREQITANPAAPVLPAGFGVVQNKSGQYGVRKPDGSVMPLGQ